MANFLDNAMYGFDTAIFSFFGSFQCGFLNHLADFVSAFGTSIAFFCYIALAVFLCIFKKTRRYGVTLAFGLAIGVLVTNFILKPWIARPRPYLGLQDTKFWDTYKEFYAYAGSVIESDLSFPSGHTTVAFNTSVGMTLVANENKNPIRYFLIPFAVLIALSRIYLMVHYPTDVIAGFVVGTIAGVLAYLIMKAILGDKNGLNNRRNRSRRNKRSNIETVRIRIN